MSFRYKIPRLIVTGIKYDRIDLQRTCVRAMSFHEFDRKGGYKTTGGAEKKSELWHIKNGMGMLKHELKQWRNEMKERLEDDPILLAWKNEVDIVWQFNGDQRSLDDWIVTADSHSGEGFSKCSLCLTQTGKGLFSGYLDTRVPKTGDLKKAGYCNIKTVPLRKSFGRELTHQWHMYNHIVMRIRGDGRSFLLNLATPGSYDINWNDVYHYPLYTRGGPYWQWVKIPFSKFFLSTKGRVQDRQEPIDLDGITSFGISAGDKVTGTFHLEIDYIGLLNDPNHTEECAYESYETDRFIANY